MTTIQKSIGTYEVIRQIGVGGFGITWLVEKDGKRYVAKIFKPQTDNNRSKAMELFKQEAHRLETVGTHNQIPNLVEFLDLGEQLVIIQEYIKGETIEQILEYRLFSPVEMESVLKSLLNVLRFIHENEVIHRDIKPANIIRRDSDGAYVLVDFGAAKVATATQLAKTGTSIGSAEYTSLEQGKGHTTFSSDIYSLGVTCLVMVAGVSPWDMQDSIDGSWHWQDFCQCDKKIADVLNKMIALFQRDRYTSAADVLKDLNPTTVQLGDVSCLGERIVEPELWYDRFLFYRNLGPTRQIEDAWKSYPEKYEQYGQGFTLRQWADAQEDFYWDVQVQAWDEKQSLVGTRFGVPDDDDHSSNLAKREGPGAIAKIGQVLLGLSSVAICGWGVFTYSTLASTPIRPDTQNAALARAVQSLPTAQLANKLSDTLTFPDEFAKGFHSMMGFAIALSLVAVAQAFHSMVTGEEDPEQPVIPVAIFWVFIALASTLV